VYALGVTLYYALTAALPERPGDRGGKTPRSEGLRPRARRPDVPVWLDAVVGRATAADPADRFASVGLMATALALRDDEADIAPVVPGKERCALCHAVEPFGIGICPRCARRSGAGDDVLVFLERTTAGPARRAVEDALDERIGGDASAVARGDAATGARPLMRIPLDAAPRVLELLEAHGLPARTEPRKALRRAAVPRPVVILAGVVAVTGSTLGLAAATPVLLITSPLVAGGLVALAAALRRTPVWNPPAAGRSSLPEDAERAAVRTLAALPAGAARSLFVDLLRRAKAVTVDLRGEQVGSLIVAACGAARDLAALEQHLAAFDARRDRLADASAQWLDALSRCEQGRDLLTQRLLEASAALSGWQARVLDGEGTDALASLTRDLDAEGRRQEAAAREVAELLA